MTQPSLTAKQGENRLLAILDAIPDLIFRISHDGKFLNFVPSSVVSPALPPAQFLGRTVHDIFPNVAERCMAVATEVLSKGSIESFEYALGLPDGQREYEARVTQCDEASVILIARDITESNQLKRRLAKMVDELKTEAVYEDFYENAPDMYLSIDAATATIVECNNTLAKVTGYSKTELLGRCVFDIHDVDYHEQVKDQFMSFVTSGKAVDGRSRIRCKDGSTLDVSLHATAVRDQSGAIVRSRSILRDITGEIQAQDLLERQREQLAHLMRVHTMGEMASGIAHELNQPLNAIVNYARGFARRVESDSKIASESKKATREIVSEAERAAGIIQGLRRLVGDRETAHVDIDIWRVVMDAVGICRIDANRSTISISANSETLPVISGDAVQLEQVVICLLQNSIDALKESSPPEAAIHVMATTNATGCVEISVRDNGPGLPSDRTEHIFTPYFTTKTEGLGLGLSICASIVERHGGRIWAEPCETSGAELKFVIPASDGDDSWME